MMPPHLEVSWWVRRRGREVGPGSLRLRAPVSGGRTPRGPDVGPGGGSGRITVGAWKGPATPRGLRKPAPQ